MDTNNPTGGEPTPAAAPAAPPPPAEPGKDGGAPAAPATPPAAEPPKAPADDPVARARVEAKQREWEQRARKAEPSAKQLDDLRELVKKGDITGALKALGGDPDVALERLTEAMLDKPEPETKPKWATDLEARLAAFETQQQQTSQQRAYASVMERVKTTVTAAKDKFEHIVALGAWGEVADRVLAKYNEDRSAGPPDIEEIAAEVEKDIEEHRARPLLSLSRYQSKQITPPNGARAAGSPTLTPGGPSAGTVPSDDLPSEPNARLAALLQRMGK